MITSIFDRRNLVAKISIRQWAAPIANNIFAYGLAAFTYERACCECYKTSD